MTSPRTARSPVRRGATMVVTIALLAAIAAGCGGSPKPASINGGPAQTNGPAGPARQFAACMRSHGLPNFPDPIVHISSSNGSATSVSVGIRITPQIKNSPAFKSATVACNHILPQGPTSAGAAQQQVHTRALVAFAQCLRTHGFPHFPDPDAQGELSLEMVNAAGINLHTPALLTAAKGCTSVTHGQITPAQVVRAINGPH